MEGSLNLGLLEMRPAMDLGGYQSRDERSPGTAYALWTLSSSEALAIVFGVKKKIHQFLYGRRFALITDHKPLLAIFSPKSAIPKLAAARMQRWTLVLSAHDYEIEYKRSDDHANCDALSRLPRADSTVGRESALYRVRTVDDNFPITARDIGKATLVDSVLGKVHQFVMSGGLEECPDENLKPYQNRRNELSCEQDCVLWGTRVIIPPILRGKMLGQLHWKHPGVCGMKAIAPTFMWWPLMDQETEEAK